jgi:hypothetical protein
MPNTTNFNFPTPADTDLVKDGALAIRNLGNSIDTTFVDLKGGTTGQVLSKNSNTDLDYAWVAQDDSNAIQNAIIDAKGDLIVGTANDTPARLAVGGTNGHVLTVDSAEASGIKWAAVAAGGMTLISETIASSLSSLTFSSLGSYKQLLLMYSGIRHSDNSSSFGVRFNNDSSAIYHNQGFTATGGNGATVNIAGNSPTHLGNSSPTAMFAFGQGTNNAALVTDCQGYILIDNYTSSTKGKTVFCVFQYYDNGAGSYSTKNGMSYYDSTSAITSLDVVRTAGSGTFSNTTNTTIRLYGVA